MLVSDSDLCIRLTDQAAHDANEINRVMQVRGATKHEAHFDASNFVTWKAARRIESLSTELQLAWQTIKDLQEELFRSKVQEVNSTEMKGRLQ